jgi:diguanylate cyclase (GGDEF)-like protein
VGTRRHPPPLDPSDTRFWRGHVTLACSLSLFACAYATLFALWTWDRPNRQTLLALVGVVAVTSVVVPLLPLERWFATPRRRDLLFFAWSMAIVGVVTVAVALDGGHSALAGLYFLPLIFATMAYPLRPTIVVGVVVVASFLVTALRDSPAPDAFLFAACLTTAAILCARQTRLHTLQRAELARLSRADPLTGCLNRRGFQERLDAELARATRSETPVGLILLDLDEFKSVNDQYGHAAGDELLCWTVARVTEAIRPTDAVGRLGGDEFAVLLPEADASDAQEVAIRIEAVLSQRTAASTGVATFPTDGIVGEELHAAADRRLYAAKRGPLRSRLRLGR